MECLLMKANQAAKDAPVVRVGARAGGFDTYISSDAVPSAVA